MKSIKEEARSVGLTLDQLAALDTVPRPRAPLEPHRLAVKKAEPKKEQCIKVS